MRALGAIVAAGLPQAPIVLDFLPAVLPAAWRILQLSNDGAAYARTDGLRVIVSAAVELDGRRWLHVSCSRPKRLPSWEDLRDVKDVFIGRDRDAYQVLPRASKHVNIMPYCLHLWACLDVEAGAVLPDFTHGGDTL